MIPNLSNPFALALLFASPLALAAVPNHSPDATQAQAGIPYLESDISSHETQAQMSLSQLRQQQQKVTISQSAESRATAPAEEEAPAAVGENEVVGADVRSVSEHNRPGAVAPGVAIDAQAAKTTAVTGANPDQQSALAPRTLQIQTTLMSALDQLKGLRTQLKVAGTSDAGAKSSRLVHNLSPYAEAMATQLEQARLDSRRLSTAASKYPELAQSDELKALSQSMSENDKQMKTWKPQVSKRSYWNDQSRVNADLDNLEKGLKAALEHAKDFGANKLDVSSVG